MIEVNMKAFFVLLLSVLQFSAIPVIAAVSEQPRPMDPHKVDGHTSLEDIPLNGRYAISSVIGNDQKSYHGVVDGTSIVLTNTVQKYSADFDAQGLHLRSGDRRLLMTLKAYGYGDELLDIQATLPGKSKNKITYRHGQLEEWYINGPYGLQQGFTLESPPEGKSMAEEPLTLLLALDGSLRAALDSDSLGMELTTPDGKSILHYSGLTAFDADGRRIPARLELQTGNLAILVNDAQARYPLTIDPVFQTAILTANNNDEPVTDMAFGFYVAISGDTMVVSASSYDTDGNEGAGAAYLFLKQAPGYSEWGRVIHLKQYSSGSIAISGDTVVVTSHLDNGMACVYVKPDNGWVKSDYDPSARLRASDSTASDCFGSSVAVDGDKILVGDACHDVGDNISQGAAYAFVKPASGWVDATETRKLTATDGAGGDNFAYSVALSGSLAVIGAYQNGNNGPGAAYVLAGINLAGNWSWHQRAKLTADDGAPHDRLGKSIAISGDTIVAGALGNGVGAAYVFVRPGASWADMTQTAKLENSGSMVHSVFGSSVGISGDTIVVGDWSNYTNGNFVQGTAFIYSKPGSGWVDTAVPSSTLAGDDGAAEDRFGNAVAIDGNTVVVGAWTQGSYNQGAVYTFDKPADGWSPATIQTVKINAPDTDVVPHFGDSIAISGDTVIVGAPTQTSSGNVYQGAAYIFTKNGNNWVDMHQRVKLLAGEGAAGDKFGYSVAIRGDTAVVGAPNHKVIATEEAGAVYVFVKPDAGWDSVGAKMINSPSLTASDPAFQGHLGTTVAISVDGNTVFAGAEWGRGIADNHEGAVYIFEKPVPGWYNKRTQVAKLYAGDGRPWGCFGQSIAIDGDVVIVGAPYHNLAQGAAYIFVKPSSGWPTTLVHTAQLVADDGMPEDWFGKAVAISGDTVVVGAPGYAIGTNQSQGTVYVYTKPTGGWSGVLTQNCRLFEENAAPWSFSFGKAVATNGHLIVTSKKNPSDIFLFGDKNTDWSRVSGNISGSSFLEHDWRYGAGKSLMIDGDILISGGYMLEGSKKIETVYLFTGVEETFPWPMFLPAITAHSK